MTIEGFYGDWRLYNDLIVEALRRMSPEELALRAASDDPMSSTSWQIWAIAGHTSAMRVYWLARVLGVPGEEATPFSGIEDGWEDHLDQPRSAEELVIAWVTTWDIVENALRTWTPEALDEPMSREPDGSGPRLTRRCSGSCSTRRTTSARSRSSRRATAGPRSTSGRGTTIRSRRRRLARVAPSEGPAAARSALRRAADRARRPIVSGARGFEDAEVLLGKTLMTEPCRSRAMAAFEDHDYRPGAR